METDPLSRERSARFAKRRAEVDQAMSSATDTARRQLHEMLDELQRETDDLQVLRAGYVEEYRENNPRIADPDDREAVLHEGLAENFAPGIDETGFQLQTIRSEATMVLIPLVEATVKANPPYLRKILPDDLVSAFASKSVPISMGAYAYLRLGHYIHSVHETGGDDLSGLNATASDPGVRNRARDAAKALPGVVAEWFTHQESLAQAHRAMPPVDKVTAATSGRTFVFTRNPDAHPSAMAVTIADDGFEPRTLESVSSGAWDGAGAPTVDGWHEAVAADVLRKSGCSIGQAVSLAFGQASGGSFRKVIAEVDQRLGTGRTDEIRISASKLGEWINSCEASFPNGNVAGVNTQLPLPNLQLRSIEAGHDLGHVNTL